MTQGLVHFTSRGHGTHKVRTSAPVEPIHTTCAGCPDKTYSCWFITCPEAGERLADVDEEIGR